MSSMGFTLQLNNLKISASQLAVQITTQAMGICGIEGYKVDSKFSLGRHLRDSHSAALMINNDRIYLSNASLLPGYTKMTSKPNPSANKETAAQDAFREELIAHKLLIPSGVDGLYGRGMEFERVLEGFDLLITATCQGDNAGVPAFPPRDRPPRFRKQRISEIISPFGRFGVHL